MVVVPSWQRWCIAHAWIELGDTIIDPTYPGEDLVYFPASRWNEQAAFETLRALGRLPFSKGQGYRAASALTRVQAMQYFQCLTK
ncbi:MAG TPA: hypothetical protein VKE41_18075 [Roseiflexaceae bacterium]|nr:hypothetical protein [Roseiflexaceae bacterium]